MLGVFVFQNTADRDAAAGSLDVARLGTDNTFSPLSTNTFGTLATVNLGAVNAELGIEGDPTRVYGHLTCDTTLTLVGDATLGAAITIAGAFTHAGATVTIANSQAWRNALGVPGLSGDNTLGGNLSVVGNLTVGGIFSHTATAANVVSLANPLAWRTAMAVPGLATDNNFTALSNTFQGNVSVLGNTNFGNAAGNIMSVKGALQHTVGTLTLDAATLTSWRTTLGLAGTGGIDETLAGKANRAGDTFTGPVTFQQLTLFNAEVNFTDLAAFSTFAQFFGPASFLSSADFDNHVTFGADPAADVSFFGPTFYGATATFTYNGSSAATHRIALGLGNVDNTSDADKPVSSDTAAALALKANDADVVKLTGNQAIAGDKQFVNTVLFSGTMGGSGPVFFDGVTTFGLSGNGSTLFQTSTEHRAETWFRTSAIFTYDGAAAATHRTALGLTSISTVTPGTGVATALSINVGAPGSFVVMGGALGTPTSGVGTNLTALNGSNITSGTVADARIAAALTGKTYNGLTITATTGGLNISNGVLANFPSNGTHSGTNSGDQTNISGTAGSATVLQTARLINGVSFNGSADIGQDLKPTASPTFTGLTTTNLTATGTFSHSGATVTITTPNAWRAAIDAGVATPLSLGIPTVNLTSGNTMSTNVVETSSASAITLRLLDIDNIKIGDVWEICQVGTGVGQVSTATTIAGQVVTIQVPPGGGPKTAGQFSTIFVRCRAKAGTGAGATATLLVTGGVS
jgi:hypothetical protein